jgi:hypothetical protein
MLGKGEDDAALFGTIDPAFDAVVEVRRMECYR